MTEILAAGYQSFKDFVNSSVAIPNEWDYIELYDDAQSAVLRVSITGDSRFGWTDVDGDALLKVEGTITGSDSDVPLPTTFEYAAIWDDTSGNNGTQITPKEQFATATVNQSGDTVTITHTIEIPDQP